MLRKKLIFSLLKKLQQKFYGQNVDKVFPPKVVNLRINHCNSFLMLADRYIKKMCEFFPYLCPVFVLKFYLKVFNYMRGNFCCTPYVVFFPIISFNSVSRRMICSWRQFHIFQAQKSYLSRFADPQMKLNMYSAFQNFSIKYITGLLLENKEASTYLKRR